MKNYLITFLFAALMTGCATAPAPKDYSSVPPTDITATVTCGTPSTKFTGTIVSDGRTQIVSGTGHGTFHATGHEIICSFKKTVADGSIALSATSSDKSQGTCNTACKFGGVRAEFVRTTKERHDIFTTF